jgi:hypothetical protein
MQKHKILSPKGSMHFVHMETREKAINHIAKLENSSNPELYHIFDAFVQKFDLVLTPQTLFENEPEPMPAVGILKILEDRKIIKTKKPHTPESLKMSMDITTMIDKYKRYGYTQYDIENLTILIDEYLSIRPQ